MSEATHDTNIDSETLLDAEATRWTAVGYRIETRLPGQIVLIKGKKPNHILHLLLSVLTLGVWLVVWLLIAIMGGERRQVVAIGPDGKAKARKS
jgi:hypothetical protein